MLLQELIEALEKEDPAKAVKVGFNNSHSYRGYYDELAFEPKRDTTVGEMLACAKDALGRTYEGYKGGEYTMNEYTPVHLAHYGHTGETIGPILLAFMLGKDPTP